MSKLFTPRMMSQEYLRRYGTTARVKAWHGKQVHIQTENGVWRKNGQGYTRAGSESAWAIPFEDAVRRIDHCGPEKCGCFLLVDGQPDIVI